ncbi:predicted protein [Uncinocarpus reesii 1704]|uniref:Uncharacterized protein n=1 Tax=Uncinocarpus reesii (strain UAMH 1704) TaxID=336963 RepID=C4JGS5_UNCRE|nr:uncharacterized protein UREG_02587 [Uncinocarpus reesii 1704]EEP77738.1 predicted protein [Uncinocarpus reesii 1704]
MNNHQPPTAWHSGRRNPGNRREDSEEKEKTVIPGMATVVIQEPYLRSPVLLAL